MVLQFKLEYILKQYFLIFFFFLLINLSNITQISTYYYFFQSSSSQLNQLDHQQDYQAQERQMKSLTTSHNQSNLKDCFHSPHTQQTYSSKQMILKKHLTQSKFSQKIFSLNTILMNEIYHELNNDQLFISQKEKPFPLRNNSNNKNCHVNQNNLLTDMSQLISKKQQIQNQLKKIQLQQYKLHINQSRYGFNQSQYGLNQSKISQLTSNINGTDRMFRSQLTEQEKQKIKEVIKNQKRFIKQLKQKQSQYHKQLQEDRIKNIQIQQTLKKQKCEQRKQYWEKVKQNINERQKQRKIQYAQQQSKLKQLKKSKKLHEKLEKSWNKKQIEDESKIKENIQHSRQIHKFDKNTIIQHQKQYQKAAKLKQQERQKSVQDFKLNVKITLPKIPRSKFFEILKEEQCNKQNEELKKQKIRYELNQRKSQFSSKVKQYFKPKIDQSLKIVLIAQQEASQKRPKLPFGQVRNLGNNYMRQVHKNIVLTKQSRVQGQKINNLLETTKPQYKNYLHQLKQKRNIEQIKESLTNEVARIMKNTGYSTVEKIERAKLVAKRLESKQNKQSSSLISSINQKMKILKVLNNS